MLSFCPNKCFNISLFKEKKWLFTLFPKSAAQLGLQDWRWRSDEMERLKVEVIDVSEISLTCVRIIIGMYQKYYWCDKEILLMCVWNSFDVCLKYYWQVLKYVISNGHIWPRNFRLSSDRHILTMRCILVTYKRTGKF